MDSLLSSQTMTGPPTCAVDLVPPSVRNHQRWILRSPAGRAVETLSWPVSVVGVRQLHPDGANSRSHARIVPRRPTGASTDAAFPAGVSSYAEPRLAQR